ncbi:Oleoyl-ACP hydrolase [Frankia canadensis]|uniref:Oleoyl-ACP hydrolase n=1 Tax=Frankia canadensis TaxID=1836972 RepID=A0A2I2L1Y1_9ACTN|nr:alpha/beta fold hydrolase [Frankia canadensis]SNQ51933.1 Oleoyl-ACP hydrolase [Frankia canadensis]SOU59223.1 Oleoyl-ACP hydrolase [Frankia canadensis]
MSSEADLWLRRFQPGPADGPRLLCFPHAGGSASYFVPLARALSPVAEVLSVQYPGRQDRRAEPPFTAIAPLADALAEVISGLNDRPLAFFGHSMGAIVAFEVTRRLAASATAGRTVPEPFVLLASGRRAPSALRDESYHRLDHDAFVAEMGTLGGTDPRILAEPELVEMIVPPTRADYQAIETYVPTDDAVISTPIILMIGDEDPRVTTPEAELWRKHTTGTCDLRLFPGGHFYLLDQAPAVITTISDALAAAAHPA